MQEDVVAVLLDQRAVLGLGLGGELEGRLQLYFFLGHLA